MSVRPRYRVRPRAPWEWWMVPAHTIAERWTGTHWEQVYACSHTWENHAVEWCVIASGGRRPEFGRLIDYGQRWPMRKS